MFEDGDTVAAGSIPIDVATGYSELLPLFSAVYGAPGGTTGGTARALAASQKALSDAIAAGLTGTALTGLQNNVTRDQEAHNKAVAKFTDASAGPIYQAGVAEWMAKAAVTKSIADYNKQVGEANDARDEFGRCWSIATTCRSVTTGSSLETMAVVTFDDADGMATFSQYRASYGTYNGDLLGALLWSRQSMTSVPPRLPTATSISRAT